MMYDGHWSQWGMGSGGGIYMLVFWGFLLLLGFLGVRFLLSRRGKSQPDETPLNILKNRYAKGEISQDDFDRMKRKL